MFLSNFLTSFIALNVDFISRYSACLPAWKAKQPQYFRLDMYKIHIKSPIKLKVLNKDNAVSCQETRQISVFFPVRLGVGEGVAAQK